MRNLTKPQAELLRSMSAKPVYVVPYYKPLQELLRRGFAEIVAGLHVPHYKATEAGLTYLAQHGG